MFKDIGHYTPTRLNNYQTFKMDLKIKKLKPIATLPKYGHLGDAGFDLFCTENVTIGVGERALIPTGLAMEIPPGFVGLVWDKSGLSNKSGLKTLGGVIDAGYRGEVLVGVINLGKENYVFEVGHKVAQMLIQKIETVNFVEVSDLDCNTTRGECGFGSTGK